MPRGLFRRSALAAVVCLSVQAAIANPDLYESALADAQSGDIRSAVIKIKNILQSDPNNLPSRLLYADILQQYGEFAAAQAQYERALELDADENLIIVPLAKIMLLRGEYEALLRDIEVAGRPTDIQIELLLVRADTYLAMRDYASAEREYRRALRLSPNNMTAMIGFAQIAFQQEDTEAFKRHILAAKEVDPLNSAVWFLEGTYERKKRNFNAALEAFDQAIERSPDLFTARQARAAILIDLDQLNAAAIDINYMMQRIDDDPYTLFLQALLLFKQDQRDEANVLLTDLSNKFTLVPPDVLDQHPELMRAKAITEFMLQNYTEAERLFLQLLGKSPSDPQLRAMMAKALSAQGQNRRAIDHLKLIPIEELELESARLYVLALFENNRHFDLVSLVDRLPVDYQADPQIANMHAVASINTRQINSDSHEAPTASESSSLLVKGYSYLQNGDLQQAMIIARELEEEASNIETLNYIGATYQALGKYEEATAAYRKALELNPDDLLVNLNLVQIYQQQNQLVKAYQILKVQEQRYPEDIRIMFQLARVAQQQGDFSTAADYFSKINDLNPLEQNTLLNWLDVLLRDEQYMQALEVAKLLEDINKFSPPMLFGKARAQLGNNNEQDAIRTLRTLLGLVGDSAAHLLRIGQMFAEIGEQNGLGDVIARLEKQSDQRDNVARLRIVFQSNAGMNTEALQTAQGLVRRTNAASDHRRLSELYLQDNNLNAALQHAKQAFSRSATNEYLPYLVTIYWRMGDHSELLALLENWLADHPDDLTSRRMFANYLQQRQEFGLAATQYQLILATVEADSFSLVNLAIMAVIQGDFEQASTELGKLNELQAQDPIVIDLKGWINFNRGNQQEGLAQLRESYARNARNPLNLYHLGMALLEQNRTAQGEQMLRRFIELSNPTTKSYEIKAKARLGVS
ncbi:tetratricopeptide repeat protein [Alteromonas sp. ASW11-36]|uniref:Tetratricopeptide repeat protein n=1 Tax=Alteromonas arenosi TaxID=3055817 RepID=A0ABT7SW52_9ALTE|nr:tetratricopeptide repeat protein [Alteromonas sp. ASW11-36]MDM7859799.1 tetratricopeptide repeat protein [Alteromonas sp. ASW11-36]